jgi:hypothetical protein
VASEAFYRDMLGLPLVGSEESPGNMRLFQVRKIGPFFEFSLYSSRACLGKKSVFIDKWLKKIRFSRRSLNVGCLALTTVRIGRGATCPFCGFS